MKYLLLKEKYTFAYIKHNVGTLAANMRMLKVKA